MKTQADKHRTERVFEEGDWVYLRLQPYRHKSLALRWNLKLSPRFYGPFWVASALWLTNLPSLRKLASIQFSMFLV